MRSAVWRIACRAIALAAFGILPLCGSLRAANNEVQAATASQQNPRCGATARDALNEAHRLLAANNSESERLALACLIEAVSDLEANNAIAMRPGGNVLRVPFTHQSGAQ